MFLFGQCTFFQTGNIYMIKCVTDINSSGNTALHTAFSNLLRIFLLMDPFVFIIMKYTLECKYRLCHNNE